MVRHRIDAPCLLHCGQTRLQQGVAFRVQAKEIRRALEMLEGGEELGIVDAGKHRVGIAHERLEPDRALGHLFIESLR